MFFLNESKGEDEIVFLIKQLSDQFIEYYPSIEDQVELLNKINFCLSELTFWKERVNKTRYDQSLKDLLQWLFDKVEIKF